MDPSSEHLPLIRIMITDSCSCKVSKVTISKFPLRVLSQDMSTSNMAPVKPEIVIGCVAYCEGTHSQKYSMQNPKP